MVRLFLLAAALAPAQNRIPVENDQVRVVVANSAPAAKTGMHEHRMNRVMIYLDAGRMTLGEAGGKLHELNFTAGQALWSAAMGQHYSLNQSGHPVRIVEVELKSKPGGGGAVKLPALDPVKVDPKRYKVEMENDQVRVIRARYGAKELGVLHEHGLNRVVTFLTDARVKVTPEGGKPEIQESKAGDVKWGGYAKHLEENVSDQPFEVMVVELKR